MTYLIKSPRKFIEVALPLDAISAEAAKSKRKAPGGYPTTFHCWWAQRPLAAARAVIFGQMVNDPGYQQGGGFKYGQNKKDAASERKRLFAILEDLVRWENSTNEKVLEKARAEIRRSWIEICALNKDHPDAELLFDPETLPGLHDPFAGGGAIPLEAQRLGIRAFASDLNPVAVTINKAMIEIPALLSGRPSIGPQALRGKTDKLKLPSAWLHASGLAEDARRYGAWVFGQAQGRIGHLYPSATVSPLAAEHQPHL